MNKNTLVRLSAVAALMAFSTFSASSSEDSHAGYYYPEPQTKEVYASPLDPLPTANKRTRIGFTVGLDTQQRKRPHAPDFHVFAKGAEAEKMIIVATTEGKYDTLYRLRALLAAMTAEARTSPLFQNSEQPENLNFLDLARLTGFTRVTITNGNKLAHRINIR